MKVFDLKERTISFFVSVSSVVEGLPEKKSASIIANQVLRSASSIGANYRAACRAKSGKDFINKLKIVEEETDETMYWLELLARLHYVNDLKGKELIVEANELISIFVTSIKTAKTNLGIPIN